MEKNPKVDKSIYKLTDPKSSPNTKHKKYEKTALRNIIYYNII